MLEPLPLPPHWNPERVGDRGGALLPHDRALCAGRLPAEGRQPAHRALFDARAGGRGGGRSRGRAARPPNQPLIEELLRFDAVVIAGQAKSHCVAWTIQDLLEDPTVRDRHLEEKIYLLEDCTSSVVVPEVVDHTDDADAAFARFAEAGAHVVRSTEPLAE